MGGGGVFVGIVYQKTGFFLQKNAKRGYCSGKNQRIIYVYDIVTIL